MKLLAHSLVPASPTSYLHLGYISAYAVTTTELPGAKGVVMGGLGLLFVGLVLFIPLLRKARWRWLVLACVLAGSLLVAVPLIFRAPAYYRYPVAVTGKHVDVLYHALLEQLAKGEAIPMNLHKLPTYYGSIAYADGWQQPLCLAKRGEGQHAQFAIYSIGPDAIPDTIDDYYSTWTTPDALTRQRLRIVYMELGIHTDHPFDERVKGLPPAIRVDGWGKPFRVKSHSPSAAFVSAGADSVFGTPDDIASEDAIRH